MNVLFGIYGAGGCGRGVMPSARKNFLDLPDSDIVFVDDNEPRPIVNGQRVLSFAMFIKEKISNKKIAIAVSSPIARRKLVEKCQSVGLSFFSIFSDLSVIMDDVLVGEGAVISPFVSLTSNIKIGKHFHANLYSYVEHDCEIGDFVTFAPGAKCNGNVKIEDGAYIGAGAVIRQGTSARKMVIGAGAVVGMGAVVTKDVAPGETVIGNPARFYDSLDKGF